MSETEGPLSFLLQSKFADKYPRALVAQFPHVARRIDGLWQDPDAMAEYFSELMVSQRPDRRGFPPEVGAEIMKLSLAYDHSAPIRDTLATTKAAPRTLDEDPWGYERAVAELEQLGVARHVSNFVRAAEAGDRHVCALFIGAGFDVDSRDLRNWTPLMVAAFNGREELAIELIRLGASTHAKDGDGYTPLHWAAFKGYQQVAALLVRKGATVDALSNAGITPLIQASAQGHYPTVNLLLQHKADPNIVARDGSTALVKAVANGHLGVVQALLQSGASIDATMQDGSTLRDIAAKSRNPKIRESIAAACTPARSTPEGTRPSQA